MPKPTHWTRCTAQRESGEFCDAESLPGAPFPICVKHASQLMAYLHGEIQLADVGATRAMMRFMGMRQADVHPDVRVRQHRACVVYYLAVRDLIKIGYTATLAERLRSYPPHARLLATEPGDRALETVRHAQFNEYLESGREWFHRGDRLMAHINSIRTRHGMPAA